MKNRVKIFVLYLCLILKTEFYSNFKGRPTDEKRQLKLEEISPDFFGDISFSCLSLMKPHNVVSVNFIFFAAFGERWRHNRKFTMSPAEVMLLLILCYRSGYRIF